MPEAQKRIDPNIVAVQKHERGSRRHIVQEQDESSNTHYKNLESELCFRESKELFHDRKLQRQRIDQLVQLCAQDTIMSDVETEYILGNVKLRLTYLKNTEFVPVDRSLNGVTRSNGYPEDRLLMWEKKKKIFSVCVDNNNFFPAFQFENQKPRVILERILNVLPKDMHGWHIALWFSSDNGWLGGDFPQNCLDQEERILNAAKQEDLELDRF